MPLLFVCEKDHARFRMSGNKHRHPARQSLASAAWVACH